MQNLIERWNGNAGTFSARIKGFHVSGTLKVTGSHIIIDGKYPLIGIIYKDRIESAIRQAAVKVLAWVRGVVDKDVDKESVYQVGYLMEKGR